MPGEMFQGEGKRVLIISAEHSGKILRERLYKSGGDLGMVMILDCSDSIGVIFSLSSGSCGDGPEGRAAFCGPIKR